MPFGSPGPYPTPAAGGPQYLKFHQYQPSYEDVTDEHVYEDGGSSYVLANDVAPIIFLFEYDGLEEDLIAPIDAHRADAFGSAFGFGFTNPRTDQVFTNVHYLDWSEDHRKTWNNSRTVRLIWRPV